MSKSFVWFVDGGFRTVILPQVVANLNKHGKKREDGGMNGKSLSAAVNSLKIHLSGNQTTVIDALCTKNAHVLRVDPVVRDEYGNAILLPNGEETKKTDKEIREEMDANLKDLRAFAIDAVCDYLRESNPQWFPVAVTTAKKPARPTADLLESLGL
jgi:hypothetical protein